ncbi:lectin-like protein [Moorena producens]|uniref:lectin-like protein n=1 Tax=Moorena producens TaxID=1155739 RepID=UPI003C72A1E6
MTSDTLFLTPRTSNSKPNFANATGNAQFTNYSQAPAGTLTNAQVETLVKGGIATAIADAKSSFINDPAFSQLFSQSTVVGTEGAFQGSANSRTEVVGNFSVRANQKFSFNFSAALELNAKEIENSNREYSEAKSGTFFFLLNTDQMNQPKIIDSFAISGDLISSRRIGDIDFGFSRNITLNSPTKSFDINGNNGIDFAKGSVTGSYQQTFSRNTNLTLVEINQSAVKLLGDTLIDNLGNDVRYGTIWNDELRGTNSNDKIYGSLGNDSLYGFDGNDILEAGQGDDKLYGNSGSDKLHGSFGNDTLKGGSGKDMMYGGSGQDMMYGGTGNDTMYGGIDDDTIQGGSGNDFIAGDADNQNNNVSVYRGHQYLLTSVAGTWDEAQAEAKRLGGNLVTINDAAEQTWLFNKFGSKELFWIGLTDSSREGNWKWVSGESASYRNWSPGEPNNSTIYGSQPEGEDYAVMGWGDRAWNDLSDRDPWHNNLRGVIEINQPSTKDTIIGGDDIITGGRGSDTLVGGSGADKFVFKRNESLLTGEFDVIKDFEVGVDKFEFQGWGNNINASRWFNNEISQRGIIDTQDGALFRSDYGGTVLFKDVSVVDLSYSDFSFA